MTTRSNTTAAAASGASPAIAAIPQDQVLSRLAALQTLPTPDLKRQWRELFGKEPPPFNRAYLQSRLAYRIQELARDAEQAREVGEGSLHFTAQQSGHAVPTRREAA